MNITLTKKTYNSFEGMQHFKKEWDNLVLSSSNPNPFALFGFQAAWWKAFSDRRRLLVDVYNSGDKIIAILPFIITKQKIHRLTFKTLSFAATDNYAADYCPFIFNTEANENLILEALTSSLNTHKHFSLACFSNLKFESSAYNLVKKLSDLHSESSIKIPYHSYHYQCDKSSKFLPILNKSNLKRPYKYFSKQSAYSVEHLEDGYKIESYLSEFFKQHISRWKIIGIDSQFNDINQQKFYEYLLEYLSKEKRIIFTVLKLKTEILAMHLGFCFKGTFYWYKPTFNPKYSTHSPGKALLYELFSWCQSNNINVFDFTVGDEPFKKQYSNLITPIHTFYIPKSLTSSLWLKITSMAKAF